MVRGEEWRSSTEDRRDAGFFLEFLFQKPSDLPSVPALWMDEMPVKRQIAGIELSRIEVFSFGTVNGKVEDGQIQKADPVLGYAQYLRHGVIGKGMNNYDTIFSILAESGFNGWMSIEDGLNGLDDMRESVLFLQHMRDKYYKR
jgi:sugar phosphate isomerase/epimerase